ALEYHRRAGDAARKVYAVEEAVEHYGAVIDAARRLGTEETDPAVRHAVLQRGRLRFDGGSPAGALPDLERALAGARSAADLGMQVEALLSLTSYWRTIDFARSNQMLDEAAGLSEAADAATQVDALGRLSIQYSNQLRFDRALEAGERALRLVEDEDLGEEKIVIALDALKLVALQLGDLERLEKLTSRLIRTLAADQGDRSFYLHWVLLEAAFVPLGAGRWEEAIDLLDEALDLARRGGTKMHEPLFLDALCWTYRSRGDYERAVEQGRLASELAYEVGSNEWAAWADATLGWALLEAGAEEEAAAVLERGMRAALEGGVPAPVARCTGLLAWARAALGDLDAAGELAGRGEELLARVSVPHGRAWLFGAHAYVAVARAHLAGGAHERAEALTAPIVAAAEGSGWHEALASGLAVLGSVRAGSGDVDGARAALERALEVAERVGLPATALEARRALEILGVAGPDRVQELPDQ
ncbi:MAG: hypothetical protein QOJ01_951, partial [Solirubrobacterales bacterium]|nr:hypothetical protein [Solirubrobacterales bacterium]